MFFQVLQNKIVPSAFLSCICIHCFGIIIDLAISTCLQSVVNLTPLAFFKSLCQLIGKVVVYVMYAVKRTVLCYIGFALNDSNASLERYFLIAKMTKTKREITDASSPGAHQEWEVVGGRDFFQGDDNQRAAAHDEFAIDLANIVPGLGEVHHQHHHHHRHHHHHHQSAASSLCHGWNNCSGR